MFFLLFFLLFESVLEGKPTVMCRKLNEKLLYYFIGGYYHVYRVVYYVLQGTYIY